MPKTILALLGGLSLVSPSVTGPESARPMALAGESRALGDTDRTRFLFLAAFEGLWQDGADPALIQGILAKKWDHFVAKCPVCMPVSHAFEVYVKSPDVDIYPSRGSGLPKDLEADLRSSVRLTRLGALEKLVRRYVERRFETVRLPNGEEDQMRSLLAAGMKLGTTMKGQGFGEFCPSCRGAQRPK